jgi:hypothetical protein
MSAIHNLQDPREYRRYTDPQETDKAFHTLEGMLKGINVDNNINETEIAQLKRWCANYYDNVNRPPFDEVINLIFEITKDNVITPEEYSDLVWVCNNITTENKYFNAITSDLQRLQGIIHGILIDNVITEQELRGLRNWIADHPYMIGTYPYDEIDSLLYKILEDNVVDEAEQNLLKVYFSQFADIKNTALSQDELDELRKTIQIPAICTMNANIEFKDKLFCFTGISSKGKRKVVVEQIESLGGIYNDDVVNATNYLILGDKNNPCWAFSCYGRKVEKALDNRKARMPIQIVKEVDFWDATY